ncbi:hypothetical protein ACOI9X_06310 [Pseudomonas sp. P2757]|uniref:hypothetical protein n=1 Tax=unclassified Pseudomonas TaxID=196821 RepID=UPI003B5A26FC
MLSNDNKAAYSADTLQKKSVAQTITDFIANQYAIESLGWAWNQILVRGVEDSAFDQTHRLGKISLAILVRRPEFKALRERRNMPQNAIFLVDDNGRLYFSYRNLISSKDHPSAEYVSPRDITTEVAGLTDFAEELRLLAKMAKLSGGWVTSGDEIIVAQWLRFQKLQVPDNEQDTRGLLDLLNFSTLPERPKYANYWELLDAPDDSVFQLNEQRRAIIKQVTNDLTGADARLVEVFGAHLKLESASADGFSNSTDYRLQRLIETTVWASGQAQDYLQALGWFTQEGASKPSPEFIEQLIIAALLLDFDPDLDAANTHFAGFDLYSREYFKRHPSHVKARLEKHLIGNLDVDFLFAPLVAEMVLGGMAPEYLFADWPASLQMGTPAWVVATQAVHLVEALIPGASRKMTYQHLMGFSQSAKAMAPLAALQAEGAVDPVVSWALMNGLVVRDAEGNLSPELVALATREYDHYITMMLEAAERFSRPLPDRRQLALRELKLQEKNCDPDELLVKVRGSGGGAGRQVSVLDLYMGDELHTKDWNRKRGPSIYEAFSNLVYLTPVPDLYEEATGAHFEAIIQGLTSNIQIAISQLDPEDAASIELGAVGVYCVQKLDYRPQRATQGGGVAGGFWAAGETGRYGVVICVQDSYAIKCFELFPLRMECRYSSSLEDIFSPLVSGTYVDLDTRFVEKKEFEGTIPLDLQAYLKNVAPKNNQQSRVQVRRIATLPADTADDYSPAPYFRSKRIAALARLIAAANPYINKKEIHQLGLQQTTREKAIEKTEAIFNVILNLIIPFKGCVEGLSSGDPKKHGAAIFDCIVDAAVLALTFVAAPVAIAAATSKAVTVASKLLSASRVLASLALSLFNPLSGLPQLLKGGGKLLGRGVAKLSGHTLSVARQARQQLRFLTGANSYDLIKALEHTSSASQVRMSLDTVAHARALLKSDAIETAQQVVARLSEKHFTLPKGISDTELRHLANNAVKETAYQYKQANDLESLIGRPALDELTDAFIKGHPLQFNDVRNTAQSYAETLADLYGLEARKARYMTDYQQGVLKQDLGKAPYSDVMPESAFNPLGYTDQSQRAAAWMLKGSTSDGNDFENILGVLREFTSNNAPLADPTVIREIHRRLVPEAVGRVRDAGSPTKYGSSPTGFSLLEQHLKTLDASHPHFDKHLLAAVVGFQGFGDGNGRTASALYSIIQLRRNGFNALPPHVFASLNGIF